jgi:hypothetical protein
VKIKEGVFQMKRLGKLFGIIATVAIMVFTMSACSNGSTDGDGDGEGGTIGFVTTLINNDIHVQFDSVYLHNAEEDAILTLTVADITLIPAGIVTKGANLEDLSGGGFDLPITKVGTGEVTVTIKSKDGFDFVPISEIDEDYPEADNKFTVN